MQVLSVHCRLNICTSSDDACCCRQGRLTGPGMYLYNKMDSPPRVSFTNPADECARSCLQCTWLCRVKIKFIPLLGRAGDRRIGFNTSNRSKPSGPLQHRLEGLRGRHEIHACWQLARPGPVLRVFGIQQRPRMGKATLGILSVIKVALHPSMIETVSAANTIHL